MRCAVTGASGFLGGAIARRFTERGWDVLNLVRRSDAENENFIRYDLTADPATLSWKGVDALVHCAWDLKLTKWADILRVNVNGSIALLRAAKAAGVGHIIFISSFSSFEGCRSLYGKAKLLVESEALCLGCNVVRPGLIYAEGEASGGIVRAIEKAVRASPIIPLIGDGSYPQYPVHLDDVAELVFQICGGAASATEKPLSAAPTEEVSFREIIETIAQKSGRKPRLIPIPWRLLWVGLKTLEWTGVSLPFRSDSLLGIVFQNRKPDFHLPAHYTITFRSFY